jgi:hypothetical protein
LITAVFGNGWEDANNIDHRASLPGVRGSIDGRVWSREEILTHKPVDAGFFDR